MGVFPQLGKINDEVTTLFKNRAKDNVGVSKLMPWIRISSAGNAKVSEGFYGNEKFARAEIPESGGLILETLPTNAAFDTSYGRERMSGRVGTAFDGSSVYAVGTDRSYRPSPTIESLTISQGTRGLSKKANFSIKCYTLAQSDLASQYFFEPGYIVLVEFGWNHIDAIGARADLEGEGPCAIAKFNNYDYILQKRKESNAMYDGFMGYITGGGFTNGDNDTYILDVELTTLGEIPAYLQIHKNGSIEDGSEEDDSSMKFDVSNINEFRKSKNSDEVGESLFMQMYNRLPSVKQTQAVKNILKLKEKDVNSTLFTDKGNFINMDDEIRKKLGNISGKLELEDGRTAKLPKGIELITDKTFIRLELAYHILNTYHVNIIPQTGDKCKEVATFNYKIGTNDTILRGHKNMFALDLSKVYIPNSQLPGFGLLQALGSEKKIKKPWISLDEEDIVNGCFFTDIEKYAFPSPSVDSTGEYKSEKMEGTYQVKAGHGTWGWLRNLYINFEFFIEILNMTNLVAKDIHYEILNGISEGVNSYWEFDIFNIPKNSKPGIMNDSEKRLQKGHPYELSIRDKTFSGDVSTKLDVPVFSTKGISTPFISSNLNMDIPAIMRDSILGKRSSANVEPQIEGFPLEEPYKFFATGPDRTMKILDSFRKINEPEQDYLSFLKSEDEKKKNKKKNKRTSKSEIRKQNLELFMSRATIIPRNEKNIDVTMNIFEDKSDNISVKNLFIVAGWNDNLALTKVRLDNKDTTSTSGIVTNPAILSIEFNFSVHGVSGIKVGDLFKLDDIPSKFRGGTFQVMEVGHELSNSSWITTIKSKMRNL